MCHLCPAHGTLASIEEVANLISAGVPRSACFLCSAIASDPTFCVDQEQHQQLQGGIAGYGILPPTWCSYHSSTAVDIENTDLRSVER